MRICAPCYQCPDRKMHCHATCEKYLEYRRKKDIEIMQRQEQSLMWTPRIKKKKRSK